MGSNVVLHHKNCRRFAILFAGTMLVGGAGCSSMKTTNSQLFGAQGAGCQSAAIAYRVERDVPRQPSSSSRMAKWLAPFDADRPPERRRTTLAVRYPHPGGRAGYARVECIVEDISQPAATPVADDASWLARVRRAADTHLPGIVLADGIHEAMGMDVRIEELAPVLARLRQPAIATTSAVVPAATSPAAANATNAVVQVACTIDNAPQSGATSSERMPELDKLIQRVRRDGSLISHDVRLADPFAEMPAQAPVTPVGAVLAGTPVVPAPGAPAATSPASAAAAPGVTPVALPAAAPPAELVGQAAVVPATYAPPADPAATTWRLPPVTP